MSLSGREEKGTISSFKCNCENEKKYYLIFDSGDLENYSVEYCQECYDSDDKQFMISMEVIF